VSTGTIQEPPPFDVAWRTIDGVKIRCTMSGTGSQKVELLSRWPESTFAFAAVRGGLTKQFAVLALDLLGFGRSEAGTDLFARQRKSKSHPNEAKIVKTRQRDFSTPGA
jgi:pimeloyl-ACP methyl ester carboxylesterase